MKDVQNYIDSGILEQYVIGMTDIEETKQVEQLLIDNDDILEEMIRIENALADYAQTHAIKPDPTIKPFLLATIDYAERMKNGEEPSFPPVLHELSKITDYDKWINRPDMVLPDNWKDFYAKIIGYTPGAITAVVWIKDMTPQETHNNEFEKFLILEGTCDLTIEDNVHHLAAGDVLSIPLYKNHFVKVTSGIPCKVILQRIAA
jgi:mannose-6-phosphate isomerase-like protein (cupin superfamily)